LPENRLDIAVKDLQSNPDCLSPLNAVAVGIAILTFAMLLPVATSHAAGEGRQAAKATPGKHSTAPSSSRALAAAWAAIPDPLPWNIRERRAARDALAAFVLDFPDNNPHLEQARCTLSRLRQEGALDAGYEYVPLPGGTFTMGVVSNEVGRQQNEAISHPVGLKCKFYEHWLDETGSRQITVPGFALGRTEVTNSQYRMCLGAGACDAEPGYDDLTCAMPHLNGWKKKAAPAELREDDRPVVCIDWNQAEQVCRWLAGCTENGCGLPTEARWEYAARGTGGQNRMFPWGDERDVWNRANYCASECECPWRDKEHSDGFPRSAPVGSFPKGATPEGILDMGGNTWEWVRDFYVGSYGQCGAACNGDDPKGPPASEERVIRGGGWACGACHTRTTSRDGNDTFERLPVNGVRCFQDIEPKCPDTGSGQ
jgi:formylglycine-generating enzyme required for sulfatase activity